MAEIQRIVRKELSYYFGSPVAYLFIGAFLAACLFVFFWAEGFFARNIADTRPLFDWMPVLLIFLAAALTMRLWSEERRAGTLELLATLPVPTWRLVLGKFLAAWALVAVALALTWPLPITVAILGPLDWGPVFGAYLATLLLAAAYLAIGMFVSARTDNPIVALIGTALICAVFYLIGSPALTALVGHSGGEILRLLGSGSRFASITRGVIDLRDLYYYLSILGVFMALTIDSLERLRWAPDSDRPAAHHRWSLIVGLTAANLLAANLWLQQANFLRADLTAGHVYTISDATENYLNQLEEPLLIRGYFSAETHPLLAPLVPQLRDLLREYQVAGKGKVQVEFVDPAESPELEREAGEQYGIQPVAFQTATKYQASVVNSYFDILVKYGDEYTTLGFRDLIDVKARGETDLDVQLRNPEYDLTRAIKKVLYGYQSGGDLFAGVPEANGEPIHLRAFVSDPASLPVPLPEVRADLEQVAAELSDQGGERFDFELIDPASDPALADEIAERYGIASLILDLLDPTPFYFSLVLEQGETAVPVPLPEELDKAGLERALEAGIKRFAPGMLRTIALYTPEPAGGGFMGVPAGPGYQLLQESLRQSFNLRQTDLADGQVPTDADLLLVVGPKDFDEKQRFAVDQFLMQGGTVVMAASPFDVDLSGGQISARKQPTGLEGWLAGIGLELEPSLVLDARNTPFPIPVQRDLGGFQVEEIQMLDYPYFPDLRGDSLSADNGITANLGQLTMNWASPIRIGASASAEAEADAQDQPIAPADLSNRVAVLLQSSPDAWTSESTEIQPNFDAYGPLGFPTGDDIGRKTLAVAVNGPFKSAFAGQASPLLADGTDAKDAAQADTDAVDENNAPLGDDDRLDATAGDSEEDADIAAPPPVISAVVDHSPAAARLILIGSTSFLTDTAISLASEATQSGYLKPLELIENAVEWSLEDRGLLALRGRGQFGRLLEPVGRDGRMFWEYLNYLLALGGLVLLYVVHRILRRRHQQAQAAILEG
ncbi:MULTISPECIES: Gldg family protein [Thiorhodovibrio]|uniref:Gldg family protein n=1 Tax=Thiorhodovibrio TaxID=61593 RepID=UPI0019118217|nr:MULTISPECIES: Gldg family protein [Thiorhodovibrio]MBK5969640.1 ABC transporter permease [Thiorhodovibrio winogradskyi]WPL14709.1 gliding motility-associated ABC transporter permease protein GldF [Thiorhodovibrio litoralis]